MRVCKVCNIEKPLSEFKKEGRYYLKTCLMCFRAQNRARTAAYYVSHRKERVAVMKERYHEQRQRAFSHYGAKCQCCGETGSLFLTIDHIDNDGHLYRRARGNASHQGIYGWLVRQGFPAGFQVLCYNCNYGKHKNNGICPHQEGSTARA